MITTVKDYELSVNQRGVLFTFDRMFPKMAQSAPGSLTVSQEGYVSLVGGLAEVKFESPLSEIETQQVRSASMILVAEFDPITTQVRKYLVKISSVEESK